MYYRHENEEKVFNFLKEKFNEHISFQSSYEIKHNSENLEINLSKSEVNNDIKITVHLKEKFNHLSFEFSEKFSSKLRIFLNKKEDVINERYNDNNVKRILELIKTHSSK